MALLRVRWTEEVVYEADLEVDGYDPETDGVMEIQEESSGVIEAILEKENTDKDFVCVNEREADVLSVLRAGDVPVEIKVAAPTHEPDFDL